ncbi:hypothetical protein DFH06DRAFT_1487279 [Mycena polygramma]|nr:hypothetical protein DFH06DRAFT_1487279 [Mycena polygramma]
MILHHASALPSESLLGPTSSCLKILATQIDALQPPRFCWMQMPFPLRHVTDKIRRSTQRAMWASTDRGEGVTLDALAGAFTPRLDALLAFLPLALPPNVLSCVTIHATRAVPTTPSTKTPYRQPLRPRPSRSRPKRLSRIGTFLGMEETGIGFAKFGSRLCLQPPQYSKRWLARALDLSSFPNPRRFSQVLPLPLPPIFCFSFLHAVPSSPAGAPQRIHAPLPLPPSLVSHSFFPPLPPLSLVPPASHPSRTGEDGESWPMRYERDVDGMRGGCAPVQGGGAATSRAAEWAFEEEGRGGHGVVRLRTGSAM